MRAIGRAMVCLWALPTTSVGLLFLVPTWLSGGGARIVEGVIEIHGGAAGWFLRRCVPLPGGASAMTLGHVVIGTSIEALNRTRRHERVHVRQCERWGPFFIPGYLIASAVVWVRGGKAYRDNWFEREAYERDMDQQSDPKSPHPDPIAGNRPFRDLLPEYRKREE